MSAQEAGSRGRAHRGDVVLVEDDTLPREGIKVRGVDFGFVPADVSPAEIVGNLPRGERRSLESGSVK